MKELLKWPLIVAATVVVLRVVVEQMGAPDSVANILSVLALHLLIVPVYLAIRIARSSEPRPYATLFKLVILYVVLTRIMVLSTYWLARIYEWPQSRFAGTWGPDVSPLIGFVVVPGITAASWIVFSPIFGGGLGSAIIALTRRFFGKPAVVLSQP